MGHNKGWDEQSFLWFDMLHYRRTGQFGRALWRAAAALEDADLRARAQAYALGYITHVGADVTGHPFVNAIAGGPFRLHWQRHHLVENHLDAFWYPPPCIWPPQVQPEDGSYDRNHIPTLKLHWVAFGLPDPGCDDAPPPPPPIK